MFLIITAALNFINLATAQAVNRSREIGVRKALGSARIQLFWQFTIETSVIVIFSSGILYSRVYPVPLLHKSKSESADPSLILFMTALAICVTLLSGSYPGLILSGFKPVAALKGGLPLKSKEILTCDVDL